jgi:oligoendopeptidase F
MGLLYKSDLSIVRKNDFENRLEKVLSEQNKNAEKEIDAYIARHPKLWGFIFAIPQEVARTEAEILSDNIKKAVFSLGIGVRLQSKRILVLIPASLDQEMVSHRICANFKISDYYTFSINSSSDIKAIIKNY